MRARHLLDLGRPHVLPAHAYAVTHPTVNIHGAGGVPGAGSAGTKCAVWEGLGCRLRILVVAAGERARHTLADHDLPTFANAHRSAGGAHDGNVEPWHRPADRADRS